MSFHRRKDKIFVILNAYVLVSTQGTTISPLVSVYPYMNVDNACVLMCIVLNDPKAQNRWQNFQSEYNLIQSMTV